MSDETVPPALTAEEWVAREAVRQTQAGEFSFVEIDAAEWFRVGARRFGDAQDGEPGALKVWGASAIVPAIVALANAALPDGDPRKITRADVELCRNGNTEDDNDARALERLAAKLAAILPPEAP